MRTAKITRAFCVALGCILVTLGTAMHLPMFLMARDMGYMLAGMPMSPDMLWGMAIELVGMALAMFGLAPAHIDRSYAIEARVVSTDTPLNAKHWWLLVAICLGLIIDVMKPASLGFVVPGMRSEYQIPTATVAWLPFSALIGTVAGSLVWGALADFYGRRSSIFLSAIMFVGTAICGAMPSFWWNVAMCFLMGMSAGGMLPVAYALLTETMPSKHRGWMLVLSGAVGAVGGYYAASECSALLQPIFGWRILWFMNIPTGLLLIGLAIFLPESPKYLLLIGNISEAEKVLKRFGSLLVQGAGRKVTDRSLIPGPAVVLTLTVAGLSWSIINFGLLLWFPADLVANGLSVSTVSAFLAKSSLVSFAIVLVACPLYTLWSTKWTVVVMATSAVVGLAGVIYVDSLGGKIPPIAVIGLLMFGASGLLATLLPYTSELFPAEIRGRATGWVAGCTKAGGLVVQALALLGIAPKIGLIASVVAVLLVLAVLGISLVGIETKDHHVDDDVASSSAAAIATENS